MGYNPKPVNKPPKYLLRAQVRGKFVFGKSTTYHWKTIAKYNWWISAMLGKCFYYITKSSHCHIMRTPVTKTPTDCEPVLIEHLSMFEHQFSKSVNSKVDIPVEPKPSKCQGPSVGETERVIHL